MQISTYAPFVHVNKQLQKTCNTFFVCLDVSNQLVSGFWLTNMSSLQRSMDKEAFLTQVM